MPLKYTPLLDMVCDVKSCRIYTLNALWKLEIWSLEQISSLPLKRVPIINSEISQEYNSYYKSRHYMTKPSFLAMTDSANQILLVNTTSVDGNIVFIDPISLSILKRIHFIFREYEEPGHIKEAVCNLKILLKNIKKSITESLKGIVNNKTDVKLPHEKFVEGVLKLKRDIDPYLCKLY